MSLRLETVSVRIGRSQLLQDVSFEVLSGEIVAVVGPNGAGKSTCLSVASGTRRPDEGRVWLEDRTLESWSRMELARRRAVVTQRSELAFAFRALDVVLLGRHPYCSGRPSRTDVEIAHAAMARLGVEGLAAREHSSLSGGERQRVQIARSLAQLRGPAVGRQSAVLDEPQDRGDGRTWLLDEPTSALDLAHQRALMRLCREEAAAGCAVLIVLHDLDLALAYADRVVLLEGGRCRSVGGPELVITPEAMREVYGVRAQVLPRTEDRPAHVLVFD